MPATPSKRPTPVHRARARAGAARKRAADRVATLAMPSKPARSAGAKRAVKFAAFSVAGTVLANAAALAAAGLAGIDAPAAIVTTVSMLAGSIAAGVQKAINWQDAGVTPPAPTDAVPPPPTQGDQP